MNYIADGYGSKVILVGKFQFERESKRQSAKKKEISFWWRAHVLQSMFDPSKRSRNNSISSSSELAIKITRRSLPLTTHLLIEFNIEKRCTRHLVIFARMYYMHTLSMPRLDRSAISRLLSPSPSDDIQFFQIELQCWAINAVHLGCLSGANSLLQYCLQGHFDRV